MKLLICAIAFLFVSTAFATPLVETFPICTASGPQAYPAISGSIVVWTDQRPGGAGIYGYNLETREEFLICPGAFGSPPDIDGNIVVWGNSSGNIDGYDLATGRGFMVNNQLGRGTEQGHGGWPDVAGNLIVWADNRNQFMTPMIQNFDIYGYDITTGQEFPICTEPGSQRNPEIFGDQILFEQTINYKTQVYAMSIGSPAGILVGTPASQFNFARDGEWLVWVDDRNGSAGFPGMGNGKLDIYGYNFTTEQEIPICTAPMEQWYPVISGPIIAWQDFRNGQGDIYGYSLVSVGTKEFIICTGTGTQMKPDIDGKYFVWTDTRTGDADIWGATIVHMPEPGTIILVAAGISGLCLARRKRF